MQQRGDGGPLAAGCHVATPKVSNGGYARKLGDAVGIPNLQAERSRRIGSVENSLPMAADDGDFRRCESSAGQDLVHAGGKGAANLNVQAAKFVQADLRLRAQRQQLVAQRRRVGRTAGVDQCRRETGNIDERAVNAVEASARHKANG